jgi:RNase P protein component
MPLHARRPSAPLLPGRRTAFPFPPRWPRPLSGRVRARASPGVSSRQGCPLHAPSVSAASPSWPRPAAPPWLCSQTACPAASCALPLSFSSAVSCHGRAQLPSAMVACLGCEHRRRCPAPRPALDPRFLGVCATASARTMVRCCPAVSALPRPRAGRVPRFRSCLQLRATPPPWRCQRQPLHHRLLLVAGKPFHGRRMGSLLVLYFVGGAEVRSPTRRIIRGSFLQIHDSLNSNMDLILIREKCRGSFHK